MEINSTLTTENVEQPIFEPKDTSLSFWKGFWYAIQFLLIQIALIIPVMIAAFVIYGMEDNEAVNNFTMALGMPLAFLGAGWFFYKKRGLIETAFQWKPNFVKLILLGTLLIFGVSYITGEVITYLPGYEDMLASYLAMFEGVNPIGLLIGGVLIAPVVEEIIFRGIILEGLSKKYDPTKAIIFSALIFGIIHFQPLQVIGAFFAGLILGWIYLKTQSLWVCIAIHVINNLIAFSFEDIGTESTREYFSNDLLYFSSFAAAAIIAYLAYLGFKRVNRAEEIT